MKKKFTFYCFVVIVYGFLFFSCFKQKYPGFTKSDDGIYYKIHFIGDGKENANENDFVKISFKINKINDSIISECPDSTIQISELKNLKFRKCISLLVEGDSATFIFSDLEKELKIEMKIHKILTPEKYEEMQKYLAWKNDGEMNELKKLNNYLKKNKIDNSYLTDGIYFIPLKKGKGNIVEIGNTVVVNYKGSFPDSIVFDSTFEKNEPFEFKFGNSDQVIKGLELAICQMKKGEKAKIIIPSQLAFGENGSSTGIVPPFTTVEYEVEIVNLK